MYLSPYTVSGHNVCASASKGCIAGCLNTSGRGRMNSVQQARLNRTKLFFEDRKSFEEQLFSEVSAFKTKCNKLGLKPAVRLNGTSDLMWESMLPSIFTTFGDIQFYDYTKHFKRMLKYIKGELPKNYHLTFSRSETNQSQCETVLECGGSVAVVFKSKQLPEYYVGYKVHNADETDLRFLDKPGVQGLYAKGKAKRDTSGFVVS